MSEEEQDLLIDERSWLETRVATGTPDIQVRRYVNEPGLCLDGEPLHMCQAPGVFAACPADDRDYYSRICEECGHSFSVHFFDNGPGNQEAEEKSTRCSDCFAANQS